MKKRNRKRAKAKHAAAFGPPGFVEFVHRFGCVVARQSNSLSGCGGRVEAAHVRNRREGWKNNVVGLCADHHTAGPGSFHHLGSAEAFGKRWRMDLDLWACAVTHQWDLHGGEE